MPFDAKRLSSTDWMIVGGGAVVFISSFLPWWSIDVLGFDESVSGWNAGFTAWAGVVLLALAALYLVLRRSDVSVPELPLTPAVAVAAVAAVGLLLMIVRWLTIPSAPRGFPGDYGADLGLYLALLAGIVEVVGAVLQFRGSGERLPWDKR